MQIRVGVCVCMCLSKCVFLFEPCTDIKCGLTIAHCPVSPPRFLSCQNSRKLGHRANKQRWLRLSTDASGPPGGTPVWMAGVGGRNLARKLISVASQFDERKGDTYITLCMMVSGKVGGEGLEGGVATERFGSEKLNQEWSGFSNRFLYGL